MNPLSLILTGSILLCAWQAAAAGTLHLPLGDAQRRDHAVALAADQVIDTHTGDSLAANELPARLAGVDLVFFGENHTDMDFHRAQAQLIRSLYAAGRDVMIGLEMFPWTRQRELDRWSRGKYTETEFLRKADWYANWGYRWAYYADIFRFARAHHLRMVAVNAPRKAVKIARRDGFDALPADYREHMPPAVMPSTAEHRRLFRASFEGDDSLHAHLGEEQLAGMLRAQATWDAVMGWNSAQAIRAHGRDGSIMVVLLGAGHVTYGLGAQHQLAGRFDGVIASVVPVPVRDRDGNDNKQVQASYADFIWGLPPSRPPEFPPLGLSLAGEFGGTPTRVIQVSHHSAAEAAGLRSGDILRAVGHTPVDSITSLRRIMAGFYWGDRTQVAFERDGKRQVVPVVFRRAH